MHSIVPLTFVRAADVKNFTMAMVLRAVRHAARRPRPTLWHFPSCAHFSSLPHDESEVAAYFSSAGPVPPGGDARCISAHPGVWVAWKGSQRAWYPVEWLRDHCRCDKCLYCTTQQRIADTLAEASTLVAALKGGSAGSGMQRSLPVQVQVKPTSAGDDAVVLIRWPDGHVSPFSGMWLRRHAFHIEAGEATSEGMPGSMQGSDSVHSGERGLLRSDVGAGKDRVCNLAVEGMGPHAITDTDTARTYLSKKRMEMPSNIPPYACAREDPAYRSRADTKVWDARTFSGAACVPALFPGPSGDLPHDSSRCWPSVSARDFLSDDSTLLHALLLLKEWGFVRIEGLEGSMEGTRAACERIGRPRPTLYAGLREDGMWRTEILPDLSKVNDTAYTGLPLASHTDGNYLDDTPGLQSFHALRADETGGGRSLLIDGLAAAAKLQMRDPAASVYFATHSLPFHHTEPTHDVGEKNVSFSASSSKPPAIVHAWKRIFVTDEHDDQDDAGNMAVAEVHWNADDRAPFTGQPGLSRRAPVCASGRAAGAQYPSPAAADVMAFYRHVPGWTNVLADPSLHVWLSLQPGTMLVFDNTRVLHGRSAVHAASERVLAGCYHSAEDWKSRLRALWHKAQA